MNIGVGVEGKSDRDFWNKVLKKHFPRSRFDIRMMGGRQQLIRQASSLLDNFRNAHYAAGFIILDRDDDPCITSVLSEFDDHVREELKKTYRDRFLHVCVAVKEVEAWFLADAPGINLLLPKARYTAPDETGTLNAEKKLKDLWKQENRVAFNKVNFSIGLSAKFDPERAIKHSASFKYFWTRLSEKCG